MIKINKFGLFWTLLFGLLVFQPALLASSGEPSGSGYTYGSTSPDGTGKYYMGREISQIMGHRGAQWLERPEREREEKPARLIESLKVRPGETVADIGAGTGYFSWRLAEAVGESGFVYAVDIQPEMLEKLEQNMRDRRFSNYRALEGSAVNPGIPASTLDLAIMVDVYHEFSHPAEMLTALRRALKPGGRVVFVEYRAEDPSVPIKRLHKMSEKQVKREAEANELEYVETISTLPRQHIIVFRRAPGESEAGEL